MKAIVLAGGTGSRLHPITLGVSKQLLPVYNKPMIYYPLSIVFLAGIREILIITTPYDLPMFRRLLGDGSDFGVHFSFAVQKEPRGISEAFIIAKDFIANDSVCLILGDNIFYANNLSEILNRACLREKGATLFAYEVSDPSRYGVVSFNEKRQATHIEEKPRHPQSHYAVTGLYFYDNEVVDIAHTLKPSRRGELEITDLNNIYIQRQMAHVEVFGRGCAWLDTGTYESLIDASQFVRTIEERQGLYIACLEEIAYLQGFITIETLFERADLFQNNSYGRYLYKRAKELKVQLKETSSVFAPALSY